MTRYRGKELVLFSRGKNARENKTTCVAMLYMYSGFSSGEGLDTCWMHHDRDTFEFSQGHETKNQLTEVWEYNPDN